MEQSGKQSRHVSNYSTHSLFDGKTKEVIDGLSLASCNPNDLVAIEEAESQPDNLDIETKLAISEAKFCNACQVHFSDREEQLLHYKSDWHRYNLHLRLRGAHYVTEDQFETISGDVSSISGSDDEEDRDNYVEDIKNVEDLTAPSDKELEGASLAKQRDSHKVFFKNKKEELISLYRCLLHHKKHPIYEKDALIAAASELPRKSTWAVLMVTCGHFAGAIFDGNNVLEHKTFHRYTVRKKRGSAQSSHDNKGQHANSAGANLRRYNEAALVQEVQELLSKWKDLLKSCHFVFVRIPIANRGMFFAGKNAPFQKDDVRIRLIPFPTRRPTFSELKRVQQLLASVECFGREADFGSTMPRSPRKFYNKESGQLEIKQPVDDVKPQTSKSKPRPSSAKSKTQNLHESPTERGPVTAMVDDNEELDMDLVETVEEINFAHLKEFEHSPKKKRNKVKDNGTVSKIADLSSEEREIRWKNSLFTASKTGNENVFKIIIVEMATHHKEETKTMRAIEENCEARPTFALNELLTSQSPVSTQKHSDSSQVVPEQQSHFTEPVSSEASADSEPAAAGQSVCNLGQIAEFLNKPLGDGGQTLLHVASKENQAQLVLLLLEHGANPAIKDKTGKTPYNLGGSDVRNTFRRFMSLWPDKYDYSTAQIPSPLTEEMEAEKRRKVAEKRKAKKKAANERNKEKKAAEALVREEEKEKERFLALSDREKRALAAERRLLQQHSSEGSVKPILSRCWQCASDITGKTPFEYSDYKFCSTKCLRDHRSKT